MLYYEEGDNAVSAGTVGSRHCTDCRTDALFALEAYYRVHQLNIFMWIGEIRPYLTCLNCGAKFAAEGTESERQAVLKSIPFGERWGWAMVLGGLIALMSLLLYFA